MPDWPFILLPDSILKLSTQMPVLHSKQRKTVSVFSEIPTFFNQVKSGSQKNASLMIGRWADRHSLRIRNALNVLILLLPVALKRQILSSNRYDDSKVYEFHPFFKTAENRNKSISARKTACFSSSIPGEGGKEKPASPALFPETGKKPILA
ncbi:MAG: hypothetical protein HUJ54_05970 [Erysipelotrichaceae bacterium]|nr:hypothetical protein [Erysipelotrichaceae bacterium]